MKNLFTGKINTEFELASLSPNPEIWDKIIKKLPAAPQRKSNPVKMRLIPVVVTVVLLCGISIFSVTPAVLKLLGSEIGFFDTAEPTKYSSLQEHIKSRSSEVGITVSHGNNSYTIDNIAFSGNALMVFYTVRTEKSISEFLKGKLVQYTGTLPGKTLFFGIVVDGRSEFDNQYIDRNQIMNCDGYMVSDNELKCVQRFFLAQNLPQSFDVTFYPRINAGQYYSFLFDNWTEFTEGITVTLDLSENQFSWREYRPQLHAVVAQEASVTFIGSDTDIDGADRVKKIIEHDITIEKVSLSIMGNYIAFTQHTGGNIRELFFNYIIMDDLGNAYERYDYPRVSTGNYESEKIIDEFFGIVPENAAYLKLVPFNHILITDRTKELLEDQAIIIPLK